MIGPAKDISRVMLISSTMDEFDELANGGG